MTTENNQVNITVQDARAQNEQPVDQSVLPEGATEKPYKKWALLFVVQCAAILVPMGILISLEKHRTVEKCLEENPGLLTNPTYSRKVHSDTISFTLAFIGNAPPMVLWCIFLYFGIVKIRKEYVFYEFMLFMNHGAYSQLFIDILKNLLYSPRPSAVGLWAIEPLDACMSTPSGHTNAAWLVFAWFLCMKTNVRFPWHAKLSIVLVGSIWAFTVPITRVMDNRHFPVDCLLGAIIAVLTAKLFMYIKKNVFP